MILYHGTTSNRIDSILRDGLNGPSYWGDEFIAQEFADERARKDGGEAIIFAVDIRRFDEDRLVANEIAEGVAATISRDDAFQLEGVRTWQESFAVTGSVLYLGKLQVTEYDLHQEPEDYLAPDFIFR